MKYKILFDTHLQHWPSRKLAALIGGEGSSLKSEMLAKVLLSKLLTGCCLSLSFEGLGLWWPSWWSSMSPHPGIHVLRSPHSDLPGLGLCGRRQKWQSSLEIHPAEGPWWMSHNGLWPGSLGISHQDLTIVLLLDLRHIQDTRTPKWLHLHQLSLREKGCENHLVWENSLPRRRGQLL